MKKISYIFFDLLTIAFLIGAYAIQYIYKEEVRHAPLGELSQYAVSEKCGLWYSKVYYSSCGNCADCADYCRI